MDNEGGLAMAVKAYDWVAYHARQTPERLALVDLHSDRRFSYADMNDRTGRLANALRTAFDIQPGLGGRSAVQSRPGIRP